MIHDNMLVKRGLSQQLSLSPQYLFAKTTLNKLSSFSPQDIKL